MLRTSLRKVCDVRGAAEVEFLSSNAQDFIEESYHLMIRIKSEIPEQ